MSAVKFETEDSLAIVTLNRPDVRNAIDLPTAEALAEAFRRFESEDALAVAILTGAGNCFCAGADLKAVSTSAGNRLAAEGDGPLGCTRRRPRTGTVVRPAGGGARCRIRRVLPALGRATDRRRHHPPAAAHRDEPRDGYDSYRT